MSNKRVQFGVLTALALLLTLVVVLNLLHADDRERSRSELVGVARTIGFTIEQLLAASPGGSSDPAFQQALAESLAQMEHVAWVEFFDPDGRVGAHSRPERIGSTPLAIHQEYVAKILSGSGPIEEWDDDLKVYNYFLPIVMPATDGELRLHVAELVMDTTHLDTMLSEHLSENATLFGGAYLVVLFVIILSTRQVGDAEASATRAEQDAARLAEIVETSVNEIYVFDADTFRFQYVNERARKNLGYTMEELAEMTPVDIKPRVDANDFRKLVAPIRSGEEVRTQFDTEHQRKDGSTYPVLVNLGLSGHGDDDRLVAIILDQSDYREAELRLRQAQKMEAVGQLSAGVAHDFNNMLTAFQGYVELIRAEEARDAIEEDLDEMERIVQRAASLTRKLLAFGRRQPIDSAVIDLNDQIESLLPMLRRLIREDIGVSFLPSEEPPVVLLDPGNLEQIVTNLVINARDAMPNGGEVTISLDIVDSDRVAGLDPMDSPLTKSCVRLVVADQGLGIDLDMQDRVFEPFFTTKAMGDGTGLGLSMVHGITHQAGGVASLESTPGKGTSVTVYLPLVEQPVSEIAESEDLPLPAGRGERILVCEDDPGVRTTTSQNLARSGFATLEAASPEEALELIRSHPDVSLLLTDIVMPGMNGYELVREVHKLSPHTRILFMSGYDPTSAAGSWPDRPTASVMEKPFSAARLMEEVQRAIDTPAS